jgi:hypothetical protein
MQGNLLIRSIIPRSKIVKIALVFKVSFGLGLVFKTSTGFILF